LAMVATAIITEFSYRYIETPIRRGALGAVWQRARAPRELRDPRDRSRRGAALIGAFVGTALAVFAGASLVTAELQQNAVEESLEEGAEVACDVVNDPNCDGVDDEPAEAGAETTAPASSDVTATTIDGVVPATTIAPTTTLTPSVIENLALGDSVMLGAADELADIGIEVIDAEVGRQWWDASEVTQSLSRSPSPDVVVVHLGNKGALNSGMFDAVMEPLADAERVVFVNVRAPRRWQDLVNREVAEGVSRWPNAVLLDWHAFSSGRPELFARDGVHLSPAGRALYVRLVAEAATS